MKNTNVKNYIGVRHEDKYIAERRVAVVPKDVKKLKETHQLEFHIQSSPKRIFSDAEYQEAGANIQSNLKQCPIIIGVKEVPIESFEEGKTYIFFSHVIKGQAYNMPMLKKMMEMKCNLIDYEKIEDELGKRLIFFGKYAGLAGMINTLWAFGQRYERLGIDTPFKKIKQAHKYSSLEEAKEVISQVGKDILNNGIPKSISPFIIALTGYGNVSSGVQEILNLLPSIEIKPDEIIPTSQNKNSPNNVIYKIVFKEEHLAKHKANSKFDLDEYYTKPELYESKFQQYIPHINGLVNGMYWDERYPRIVTKDYLEKLFNDETNQKLTVIGDITCDPNGSIECTHKGTAIEDPVFVYHPKTRTHTMGFDGEGVLMMPVDILPSELPKESSEAFSAALRSFIPAIASANFNDEFKNIVLPAPIKKAMILHKGKLTPKYEYIKNYL